MFIVCLFTIPIAKTAVQLRETDDKRAAKLMNDLKFQTSTMILCLLVIALDTFIGTLINGYQIMFLTCIDAYVFGSYLFSFLTNEATTLRFCFWILVGSIQQQFS